MLKSQSQPMPPAPPLRKLLGPSFILLGLGLGSGEIILWPYLSANWGLGIAWGAFLGIFFQFFINMEIERYSLARGESVFIGLARRWKWVPFWLMFSTIVSFGWPGIIASSATLFAYVFGGDPTVIGIIFLMLIGIILSTGKYIYTTVDRRSCNLCTHLLFCRHIPSKRTSPRADRKRKWLLVFASWHSPCIIFGSVCI